MLFGSFLAFSRFNSRGASARREAAPCARPQLAPAREGLSQAPLSVYLSSVRSPHPPRMLMVTRGRCRPALSLVVFPHSKQGSEATERPKLLHDEGSGPTRLRGCAPGQGC